MSCISQIIAKKDTIDSWPRAEGGGQYKGYEYLITFTNLGHRCGYVALHGTEGYADKDYGELYRDIDVHGGFTFKDTEHPLKDHLDTPCNDEWIGFDCGHTTDKRDLLSLKKYAHIPLISHRISLFEEIDGPLYGLTKWERTVKDYAFVEAECKSVIDQLLKRGTK